MWTLMMRAMQVHRSSPFFDASTENSAQSRSVAGVQWHLSNANISIGSSGQESLGLRQNTIGSKKKGWKRGTNTQTEYYLQLNLGQKHHFFWLRRANDAGVASAQTSSANRHCPAHLWALGFGDVLVSGPRASAIETWRVDTAHHEEEDILTRTSQGFKG